MRKINPIIGESGTAVVFINQLRDNVGVAYGPKEVTPGGRALKFYASVRIDLRKREQLRDGDRPIGLGVKSTVIKNKVAPPFRKAEFDIMFKKGSRGISHSASVLDMGKSVGVLKQSGPYVKWGEETIGGRGRLSIVEFLDTNLDVRLKLEKAIIDEYS